MITHTSHTLVNAWRRFPYRRSIAATSSKKSLKWQRWSKFQSSAAPVIDLSLVSSPHRNLTLLKLSGQRTTKITMKSLRGVRRASSFLQLRLLPTSKTIKEHRKTASWHKLFKLNNLPQTRAFYHRYKILGPQKAQGQIQNFFKIDFQFPSKTVSRILKQVLGAFQFELTQNKFGLTFTFGCQHRVLEDEQDVTVRAATNSNWGCWSRWT